MGRVILQSLAALFNETEKNIQKCISQSHAFECTACQFFYIIHAKQNTDTYISHLLLLCAHYAHGACLVRNEITSVKISIP